MKHTETLDEVTVRFAGDSGDGMQLTGTQFSDTSASIGNDVTSFPDYPSEVRAPEGTLYGVSAYQMSFGSHSINTPGDEIDLLVAMNASSLKVSLAHLKKGGIIVANSAGFKNKNLKLAKYETNPLEDGSLNDYKLHAIDINEKIHELLSSSELGTALVNRTKNIYALGIAYWLYNRPLEPTETWLKKKFGKKPEILDANLRVLKAGYNFAAESEEFDTQYEVKSATLPPGKYRNITGNEAVALGLVAAATKLKLPLFLGSYPITPATEILHFISGYKQYGVKHMQMEDEIGGITSAIGAAFGGALAATTTSGPGLSLKVEAMGLAVITELPLVIVDVQRAGPSTGLPTKPEQSDLLMAMYGRHGEAPMPVLAAQSSNDCFNMTLEACRIAVKYMTPVILLTDGYIAQGAEPWRVPKVEELPEMQAHYAKEGEPYQPYRRDSVTLARKWAIPGTRGLEHRIGGLEKQDVSGNVSHDPDNHQRMIELRQAKIDGIANDIPEVKVNGDEEGKLVVLSWGSTYGATANAIDRVRKEGLKVSHIHLKYINPFPRNLESALRKFDRILIPEINSGHLRTIIRSKYLLDPIGFNEIKGKPFVASEIADKIKQILVGDK